MSGRSSEDSGFSPPLISGMEDAVSTHNSKRLDQPIDGEAIRKLFTRELAHVTLAYLGAEHGYVSLGESAADEGIRRTVSGALMEAAFGVREEFGFTESEMTQYGRGVLQAVMSCGSDRISQLGLDPEHDLRRDGPLTGAALLAWKHGKEPCDIARAAAAALRVGTRNQGSNAIASVVEKRGPAAVIRQYCELRRDDELLPLFLWIYMSSQPEDWKRQLAERAYRAGFEAEIRYRHCCQGTLSAILDTLFLREDATVRAVTPLAGGVAQFGDGPCGSYLGAAIALGIFSGRRRSRLDGDREAKHRCFRMCAELRSRYMETYGGLTCQEVQRDKFGRSFDLWDERDKEAFDAAGAHTTGCTDIVGRAAQWAVEMLCQPPTCFESA